MTMTRNKLILILVSILSFGLYVIGNFIKEDKRQEKKIETIIDIDFEMYLIVSEDDEQVCIVERKKVECYNREY